MGETFCRFMSFYRLIHLAVWIDGTLRLQATVSTIFHPSCLCTAACMNTQHAHKRPHKHKGICQNSNSSTFHKECRVTLSSMLNQCVKSLEFEENTFSQIQIPRAFLFVKSITSVEIIVYRGNASTSDLVKTLTKKKKE